MKERASISQDYQEFATVAEELAWKEVSYYPEAERPSKYEDRFKRHLIRMTELYQIRYGKSSALITGTSMKTRKGSAKLALLLVVLTLVSMGLGYGLCLMLGGTI